MQSMKKVRHLLFLLMSFGILMSLWASAHQGAAADASAEAQRAQLCQGHSHSDNPLQPCSEEPFLAFEIEEDEDENDDRQHLLEPVIQFVEIAPSWPLAAKRHSQMGGREGTCYLKYNVLRL